MANTLVPTELIVDGAITSAKLDTNIAVSGSEEDMYQMDYSKLVVHLVAGMKEQQTQIEALQSEIKKAKKLANESASI